MYIYVCVIKRIKRANRKTPAKPLRVFSKNRLGTTSSTFPWQRGDVRHTITRQHYIHIYMMKSAHIHTRVHPLNHHPHDHLICLLYIRTNVY